MKGKNDVTKPGGGKVIFIRFGSRLAPLANAILRRRYIENTAVKEVLAWLAEQNAGCSRQTYQIFIRRLLVHLPDAQAEKLGIELPVLHAIRRRLRLPLEGRRPWKAPYKRGVRSPEVPGAS